MAEIQPKTQNATSYATKIAIQQEKQKNAKKSLNKKMLFEPIFKNFEFLRKVQGFLYF